MHRVIMRFLIIFGIIYASLLGGVVEHVPLLGIAHQVGATLVLGSWLLSLWRSGRPFPSTPLDAPILAAGLVWTLSAALAREPRVSLVFAWVIWVHILIFYLLVDLTRRGQRYQQWIMEGLFMMGAVIVLLSALEMSAWYFGWPFLPQFAQGWPPLFGLTVPPVIHEASLALNYNNPTGAYCLLVIPLAAAGVVTHSQRDLRAALGLLAVGLVGVVIFSKSRGAYMGLAAMVGMLILLGLLQAETRARCPARLRPLLDPRLLIAGAALAAMVAGILVFRTLLLTKNPDPTSFSRIDLWYAATQIFHDHPLVGIGPRQFGAERLWYLHWEGSYNSISLKHAHSVYFNVLAEGGILGLTTSIWLVVRGARLWWSGWQKASLVRRRRLVGVLIAMIAFAIHNLVDTFVHTQLMIPVLIIAAYLVAGELSEPEHAAPGRRRLVFVGLGFLAAVQAAFIPLHLAVWRHQQALNDLNADRLTDALAAERSAQQIDPWLDLYRLQEADILGRLAAADPARYLDEAITVCEDSLRRSPRWDLGWHNMGALYAQAGRYEDAIRAAQHAIALSPTQSGYHLKLAEYYTAAGDADEARQEYFEALRHQPWVAASDFWTAPSAPERSQIRTEAISYFAQERPEIALDIAIFSNDLETAVALTSAVNPLTKTPALRSRLEALWPEGSRLPCVRCYDLLFQTSRPQALHYVTWAERLLHGEEDPPQGLTAEKAARAALFLSENESPWSWYILAQVAEQQRMDTTVINDRLARAFQIPNDRRRFFDTTVYALDANLDILPQALTPRINRHLAEPWLVLAARYEAAGEWDNARTVYERLLEYDPYARDWREYLSALPG